MTSKPILRSSPWIRGAPHSGLSTLMRRIRARRSASICGRPPRHRDFQRQYRRKPARCQRTTVSGRMIVMTFEDRRKPTIELDQEQAIAVRKMEATAHLSLQYNKLTSKGGVLCLKSAL